MPEPTPLRLSSAEDRFRSGVSAGLLGESAEVARGEPRVLEEISSGPPSAGGTQSSTTALAGPQSAAEESCKQHLGSLPTSEGSTTYCSEFFQTTSFWILPCRWVISSPMLSKFYEWRTRIQSLRDSPAGDLSEKLHSSFIGDGLCNEDCSRTSLSSGAPHLLGPSARHVGERTITGGIRAPPESTPLPTLRPRGSTERGPWCAHLPDLPARWPDHH